GDSLLAVTLFTQVERRFGVKPPLAALLEHPTIRKLAVLLETMLGNAPDSRSELTGVAKPPLVAIQPEGDRPPLYVVHGDGGNVLMLSRLLPDLAPAQPLYGITARGLTENEAPHREFDAMVEDYLAGIRRVQPRGPYNLGGYCIGGIIACEMGRRLRAAGEDGRSVVMIDPDYKRALAPLRYWRSFVAPAPPPLP